MAEQPEPFSSFVVTDPDQGDVPVVPLPPPEGDPVAGEPVLNLLDEDLVEKIATSVAQGAALTSPQTDTSVVKLVTLFLGVFALMGLAMAAVLGWKIATTGISVEVAAQIITPIVSLTGVALGALGTLLATTRSSSST